MLNHMLAIVNFAQTVDHLRSPALSGFQFITPSVYNQASNTIGHIESARPLDDRDDCSFFDREWGKWGPFKVPNYYIKGEIEGEDYEASALSVWEDLYSLYSFVYSGLHLRAIQRKKHWFAKMEHPNYAMWWTDIWPTWEESTLRLEYLSGHSESEYAFTFKTPFTAEGKKTNITTIRKKLENSKFEY